MITAIDSIARATNCRYCIFSDEDILVWNLAYCKFYLYRCRI